MARTAGRQPGRIHAGIGGWTYAPWRGVFYPKGLPHAQELAFAAQHLTAIEVNGTFYRTQSPATFRKWAAEVPDDFVFALKAPRFAVNRRVLAEGKDSVRRFMDSGIGELGGKLGPLLWQFTPTKSFDARDFGKFLELLPASLDGRRLRHVVEVRHDSFCVPAFPALLRQFDVALVYADHATYPAIADITSDFVYARLQKGSERLRAGYAPKALDLWAQRARVWAAGGAPDDLPWAGPRNALRKQTRDVFMFFIHEAKLRAPAAAMALIARTNPEKKG